MPRGMPTLPLPPLPGFDPATAPAPNDPSFETWLTTAIVSPEGVDRSLIWASLHRTPAERMALFQEWVDTFRTARPTGPGR